MCSSWPTPDQIIPLLEPILQRHPDGLSEYELLNQLAEQSPFFAKSDSNSSSQELSLFQRHFLLFHCLYLIEQQHRAKQSGILVISALEIRLHPYREENEINQADAALITPDPVRNYYLDITQLQATSEHDLDEMLGRFWLALARNDIRDETLALLGLSDPVDDMTIRKRYRQLVMQHHPDRGGDVETIQQLNAAISNLLPKSS